MMTRTICAVLVVVLALPVAASAQAWDAPSFFSPRPGEDLGVYAAKPDGGGDWGVMGIWRTEGNLNLGVRAGWLAGDAWMVGAEFHGPVELTAAGSGLLLSWVMGAGASFGDGYVQARVPLGLSIGAQLGTPSVNLLPYVHPRVALDVSSYDLPEGQDQTDTDLRLDVDIGADAVLNDAFVLRVGATIGSDNTFGMGIAYRLPRRLVVR